MRKAIAIFVQILVFSSCSLYEDEGEVGYSQIELDSFVLENYYADALQLYMNEVIQNDQHPDYNDPNINYDEVTNILKIIQAVYNSNSPERDLVFNEHQIHTYSCYSFNSVTLKVNTELQEINNLSQNIIPTGEPSLDNILITYDFDSVNTLYGYSNTFPYLTVFSKNVYNMIPIENDFENLPSVLLAESNKYCIGDGNNISLTRYPDHAVITFSIGWGDCPAGCIYHKYWEFMVQNGNAVFIRTY